MTTIQITDVAVDALHPNDWNTNHVSPENEERIEASLKRLGFYRPIIARETDSGLEILGGQHRWQVAKRMGYKAVPVINLGRIDDKRAKEIGLVDNGRYGEDDTLQLAELLRELGDVAELMSFLPYTGDELEGIFSASNVSLDDLDIPDDDTALPDLSKMSAPQTHQIMRFKVPVEDSEFVQKAIEQVMRSQGYTDDDSMTNAGNALVHLIKGAL